MDQVGQKLCREQTEAPLANPSPKQPPRTEYTPQQTKMMRILKEEAENADQQGAVSGEEE